MGFFDSLKKGWTFMKAAFRMAGENRKLLAPSLYLVLATIVYFAIWIAALIALDIGDASNGAKALVGVTSTFGSFLIFYFFCGMTVNMIDVHLKGGKPSLKDGAADASKNFLAIVFLTLISTIMEMLAKAARDNDSLVGRILVGIIQSIWTVLSCLLLPAIIIEDASFGQAMKRVRALHKGNALLIGVGEVGVRGLTGLIGFVMVLVIFLVVYLAFTVMSGVAALVTAFMVGGTLLALFAAFNVYLRMAYYTCLYLYAVETERAGARVGNLGTVKAPGPLGVALGHTSPDRQAA